MSDTKWYVLKVVSGQERNVKAHLEEVFTKKEFEGCVDDILIPVEKVYSMQGGKRKVKDKNTYPGYLFLSAGNFDGRLSGVLKEAQSVMGLLTIRGWGGDYDPVPLRKSEVNRLLGKNVMVDEGTNTPDQFFIVGEHVKVIDGPFTGFVGTVAAVFGDRKKLSITVKIFERNTPVELGYAQVERPM